MNLLTILGKRQKRFYVVMIALGGLNSLFYSSILVIINKSIGQEKLPYFSDYMYAVFVLAVLGSYLTARILQTYMIKSSRNMMFDLEISLLRRLRMSEFQAFHKLGQEKIYAAFADTRILSSVPQVFMAILNSAIIVICGLVYSFYVSQWGGVMIVLLMFFLLTLYLIKNNIIEKDLQIIRNLQNDYFRYLRDFIFGFRELKMSVVRSNNIFHKYLGRNRKSGTDLSIKTDIMYMNNELVGDMSWYIVIGIILFAFPTILRLTPSQHVTFVISILYLMRPVSVLISAVPNITRMQIAVERINDLYNNVKISVEEKKIEPDKRFEQPFESLCLKNVGYQYPSEIPGDTFSVGPLDFKLSRGELIFMVGGNGSGKSTFINLIIGLFEPTYGSIYFNNEIVSPDNYQEYRNSFSVVFADPHLDSENYCDVPLSADAQLDEYKERLGLNGVLKINDNNWINLNLSKGQQKRACMLCALMENKDILILDEWASEQDPHFRAYFYNKMLPQFIAEGKTVIAVTHDDTYFSCADRIVKMEYGKIKEDINYKKERIMSC